MVHTDLSPSLFDDGANPPTIQVQEMDHKTAQHALDELFTHAHRYKTTEEFRHLLDYVARFRFYSPYNAMLVHVQMAGATFVATPSRWASGYRRAIKPTARPLVMLQPRGPVMFVYDVSDTEPMDDPPIPLPPNVLNPFEVHEGSIGTELTQTIQNCLRDGIKVESCKQGSQNAGSIQTVSGGTSLQFQIASRPVVKYVAVPRRYHLLMNDAHTNEEQYATLVHELAHLYCGHLGTPNSDWWPERRGRGNDLNELEAESVCFLVCERLGIRCRSAEYLSAYVKAVPETPPISLDCILKAAGVIEQMGKARLKPRPKK